MILFMYYSSWKKITDKPQGNGCIVKIVLSEALYPDLFRKCHEIKEGWLKKSFLRYLGEDTENLTTLTLGSDVALHQ